MEQRTQLINRIEEAAELTGLSPSTIGERAGQGGRFYRRLKDGHRVWPETAQAALGKIDALINEAKGAQT